MAHIKLDTDTLTRFCRDAFCRFGFSEEDSSVITDNLLMADIYGIESHGVQRLQRYHKSIQNGKILLDAKPEVVLKRRFRQSSTAITAWDSPSGIWPCAWRSARQRSPAWRS